MTSGGFKPHATTLSLLPSMNTARPFVPKSAVLFGAPVVAELRDWYARAARTLAWRAPLGVAAAREGEVINDPYIVMLSEVMLQQTQAARVEQLMPRFLE